MTPADVRDAIVYCNAIAWGKVGAVVAALALTYGVAMSIALVVYVYLFRSRRMTRRRGQTRQAPQNERSLVHGDSTTSAKEISFRADRWRQSPAPEGRRCSEPWSVGPPASPQGSFLRGPAVAAREVGEPVVGRLCPAPEPHKCPPPRLFAPAGEKSTRPTRG